MANAIYDKYKESLMGGAANVALDSETVKISLIDTAEEVFTSTDQFYSDVANVVAVVATETLANVSITNGVLNADDISFESVSGASAEALLIWIDTGDANTSHLVAWMDTNIDGLPITPDGSNVDITWSTSGIFKL